MPRQKLLVLVVILNRRIRRTRFHLHKREEWQSQQASMKLTTFATGFCLCYCHIIDNYSSLHLYWLGYLRYPHAMLALKAYVPLTLWVKCRLLHEAGWIIEVRVYGYMNGWMEFPHMTSTVGSVPKPAVAVKPPAIR